MTSLALIVASDRYDDPALQALRSPSHDAAALAEVLGDPEIGGFEVRTLVNQPAHLVNEEVEVFFADRARDDLLLLYFSCHGVKDDSGRLYFTGSSTKLSRLAATGISSVFVNEQMDQSRSRKIVLLLDCCYSGAFTRGLVVRSAPTIDVQDRLQGRGRVVITASTAMEYAFEGDATTASGTGVPSLFTSALVEGLRTGAADLDGDGLVSVDELYDYLFERVRESSSGQTPSMISNVQGEIYVARASRAGTSAGFAASAGRAAPPTPLAAPPPVQPGPPAPTPWWRSTRGLVAAVAAGALAVALGVLAVVLTSSGDDTDPSASTSSARGSTGSATTTAPTTAPTAGAAPGVVSRGTARLEDRTQGFDLVRGATVFVISSNLAWNPDPGQLFIFDETTLGAVNLGRVDYEGLSAEELSRLTYGTGADNPVLTKAELPVGTVLGVHVEPDTWAKLRVDGFTGGALDFSWQTDRLAPGS